MAIEATSFFSFLKQTRSPIGLVDLFNLSEIYESDQRDALDNLLLPPEGLDQISGLAGEGVIKEDIRLIGGLNSPVIDSLSLFDEVKPKITFDLSTFVRVGAPLGEPGKHSFVSNSQSGNIISFQGGLAAKNIEFNYLNLNGEVRTTSVSTSRESLFNSVADNSGNYTEASYPGLLRVRRRGHYHTIKLDKKLFVSKSSIIESPGASINIPVYMRTNVNTNPGVTELQAYATKNSPFVVPIKVSGEGSFRLSNIGNGALSESYYFGYEIKRKSDNLLIKSSPYGGNNQDPRPAEVEEKFNLTGTAGDNQNCFLFIYCTPALVTGIGLDGLGIKEDLGQDLGLVGFDNLKSLSLSNNDLQNIPTWLKVNYKTLEKLDLSANPYWNNGPVSYFDYQVSTGKNGSTGTNPPVLSATQVLCYSGFNSTPPVGSPPAANAGIDAAGKIKDYDGTLNNVTDGTQNEGAISDQSRFVQIRKREVNGNTPICDVSEPRGFRKFTALTELNLRQSFFMQNADFSKVFPNLQNLNLVRQQNGGERVRGSLPRINDANGEKISYNLSHQSNTGGPIRYVGLDTYYNSDADSKFIGKYAMTYWNTYHCGINGVSTLVKGGVCTDEGMVGTKIPATYDGDGTTAEFRAYSNAAAGEFANAWSGWLANLEVIELHRNDVAFNIAHGTALNWNRLKSFSYTYSGQHGVRSKVTYNTTVTGNGQSAVDILQASNLESITARLGGWTGKIFSIQGAPNLKKFRVQENKWLGYNSADGHSYFLPDNFSQDELDVDSGNQLEDVDFRDLRDARAQSFDLEFRENDFLTLGKLTRVVLHGSGFFGVIPEFVNENENPTVINFYAENCRFYDAQNVGVTKNNRFRNIKMPSSGVDRGGMLLPNFNTGTNTNSNLYWVQIFNSLLSTYSSTWKETPSKKGQPVFNALFGDPFAPSGVVKERTTVPGITFSTKQVDGTNASGATQFLFPSNGLINLREYIRVGDDVYTGTSNSLSSIGKVLQVGDQPKARIILDANVNLSGQQLYFQRAGQDIQSYFKNCPSLEYVDLYGCSLVGKIPTFNGNKGRLKRVQLQNNLLTKYVTGTLDQITGKAQNLNQRPNIKSLDLSFNPLSLQSIKDIIFDAYNLAVHFNNNFNQKFTIDLRSTKAVVANGTFVNYTDAEIFTGGTPATPGTPGSPGDPNASPPVPPVDEIPGIPATPDPLLTKFNKLGPGKLYSKIEILIN